uniref:Nucleotide-diphospho-sugar transferase domain-containing protein n=1 Tax=Magnetococcus massalia (strain MO-1) TaxID=451514 RepID=A0A1S7LHL3_MAGMO|nr:Conserved protein of unknown function. Containing domain of glycosyl transferase family 8 [Candidatus Magnetococcus massalia]
MLVSAASLKQQCPHLPITLFTDQVDFVHPLIDQVLPIENPTYSFLDRFQAFSQSPYQKSLYLDSDTLILQPLDELFTLLERAQLAAAHAPLRVSPKKRYQREDIPSSFSQFNCGVLGYQASPEMVALFADWKKRFIAHHSQDERSCDQPAFREALWSSNITYHVLPSEYNYRLPYYALKGMWSKVVIAHSHIFSQMSPQERATFKEALDDNRALFWDPFKENLIANGQTSQKWR